LPGSRILRSLCRVYITSCGIFITLQDKKPKKIERHTEGPVKKDEF
jgi:hypothetical protein